LTYSKLVDNPRILVNNALRIAKKKGYISMLRKASSYILRLVTNTYPLCPICVHIAKHKLKNSISRLHELSEFIKFLQSFKVMSVRMIRLYQVEEEIVEPLMVLFRLVVHITRRNTTSEIWFNSSYQH